ncbi:hypothetical protein ACHAWT_008679 [Skeletonema menzelii]
MSKESPPPSPSKAAAAAAAATAAEANLNIIVPSLGPNATLEQRQLAEFNQWVNRYNNYQHQLEAYWRTRLTDVIGVGAVAPQRKKGSVNKDKWRRRYEELIDFKEEHGHTNVPSQFTYKLTPPLGDWVKRMRRVKRDGKLSDARQKLLLEIGFEFEKPKGGDRKVSFSGVWNKAYLELCEYQKEHGDIEVPDNYKTPESSCLLDMWIKRQRTAFKAGKLGNDLIQKLEELGVDLSGRSRPFGYEMDADWIAGYKELKKYSDATGNCDVPEGDANLGVWVNTQRWAYGEGQLNQHKIGMLQNLGFNFFSKGPTVVKDPWDTRFSELQAYHQVHGDTNVPRYYPLNLALGEFVHNLRTGYQHGKLTEARKKTLKDIGFTFVTSKGRKNKMTKWDTTFEELKRYKAKHGTIDIPDSDESNAELAGWIKCQRRYQKDKSLKKDRYEKLKAMGFDFGGPSQVRMSWDNQFQAIVDFKVKHGHLKIPTNYEANPSLYFWIGTQRQSYKHGKLSEERIHKLTELGLDLEIQQSRERPKGKSGPAFLSPNEWDRCFASLVKYKEEHGDCNVSQREEKERLGSFVHYMRYYHKQGKLSEEHIKKLTDIGFSFNIIDSRWSDKYEELAAFKEENGSCDVPLGHSLYAWVMYQKQAFKNGKLAEDRIDLLRKINFKFERLSRASRKSTGEASSPAVTEKVDRDEYLSELWEKSYNEMVEYKEKYGNCKIPVNYAENPSLGAWAFAQRMAYKKDKLSEERVQKLTEIGFALGGKK